MALQAIDYKRVIWCAYGRYLVIMPQIPLRASSKNIE